MFYKRIIYIKFPILLLFLANILLWQSRALSQCKQPIAIVISNKSTTSANIAWSDPNIQSEAYEIEIVKRGRIRTEVPNIAPVVTKQALITNLENSTSYDVYIRTVCSLTSLSKWTGPVTFTTNLANPTPCNTELPLKDNSNETFLIEVKEEGIIGKDVFLESVDFVIAHTWPADLEITLESPNGSTMVLSKNNGLLNDNYGDIHDTLCQSVTSVSPYACYSFKEANPPFIGNYLPDGYTPNFSKGSSATGIWKIHFKDRAAKDVGILKYLKINFNRDICQPPDLTNAKNTTDQSFIFEWDPPSFCSNTILYLLTSTGDTLSTFFNCKETNVLVRTINDLEPNTQYQYFSQSQCIDIEGNVSYSRLTCVKAVQTLCSRKSENETFDQLGICDPSCNVSCTVIGQIFNTLKSSSQWIVNKGSTPSDGTGPDSDLHGNGNYCYIENNPEICGKSTKAILESKCIQVKSNGDTCDMAIYYHMLGNQIGSLIVLITDDNGVKWDTIFIKSGNQGNKWLKASISLAKYDNKLVTFQIIGITGEGTRGDIAIDQIEFYGSTKALESELTHYIDLDQDGYGSPTSIIKSCISIIPGYTTIGGDCDDSNKNIFPNSVEITCNGIDENCNGMADDLPLNNPIEYTSILKNTSCAGLKNGEIALSINGGNPPYDVTWNDSINQVSRSNLAAGIYYAIITDTNGCKRKTEFFNVKANTTINIIESIKNPICEGINNGSITLNHSMDNQPYSYEWSNDAKTKDISNLSTGIYSVTISDAIGCVTSKNNIKLTANPSIVISTKDLIHPKCENDKLGSIEIFVSGGILPYNYNWSNQNTTEIIKNASIGSYTVTVNDSRGCKATKEYQINAPDSLKIIIVTVENVKCADESNGSIQTKIIGGSPPYSYNWNNNSFFTDDIFNLVAGTYGLTVSDNNGCTQKLSMPINIIEPQHLILTIDSLSGGRCLKGGNGFLSIKAEGGNEPYTFDWIHTDISTSTLENIPAGTYNVAAFDISGCKSNHLGIKLPSIEVDLKPIISLLKDNKCPGDTLGELAVMVNKGTAPYDYNWSNGSQVIKLSNMDSINKLNGGFYNVTITDSEGCTGISQNVSITKPEKITYTIDDLIFNICGSESKGLIATTIKGGTAPYIVDWNGGQYSGNFLFNIANGRYGASIKDFNGCLDSISNIELISESDINIINSIQNASQGIDDGKICIAILGGVEPYKIDWSNGDKNTICIDQLPPGSYTVTVIDELECEFIDTFIVERTSSLLFDEKNVVNIYPNPSSSIINIDINETSYKINSLEILSINGKLLKKQEASFSNGSSQIIITEVAGIYIIKINWTFQGSQKSTYHRLIKID